MSKITVAQAVKLGYSSQATIYRDMRTGAISYERNGKNRRLIDISELTRVYSEPKTPKSESDTQKENDNSQTASPTEYDNEKFITLLETQMQELREQITAERAEKRQLMDMLQSEQEKNKLMLPKPRRTFTDILNFFRPLHNKGEPLK